VPGREQGKRSRAKKERNRAMRCACVWERKKGREKRGQAPLKKRVSFPCFFFFVPWFVHGIIYLLPPN